MYDEESGTDERRGGRSALIAAYFAVLMLLGAAFGYVFLVPASDRQLAEYGQVQVPLNPSSQTSLPSPAPQSQSSQSQSSQSQASAQTSAAQTATGSGSTANQVTAQASGQAAGQTTSQSTGQSAATTDSQDSSGSDQNTQTANLPAPETKPNQTGGTAGTNSGARPESSMTESSGPLPQWEQYARLLSPPKGVNRIAVVVRGLGLSSAATEAAVKRLPGEVSLSFSPYARRSVEWTLRARARGHEVLMDLPMEPRGFPASDPGPRALMTSIPTPQNLDRLDWVLENGREMVGVVGQMGSEFVTNKRAVGAVMRRLKNRGLIYVDNGDVAENMAVSAAAELNLPHAVNDRTLDDGQVSRAAIEARLVEAERLAEQQGYAVVMAHPYPVTIDLLQSWGRELDQRGFALVPITNVVREAGRTESARLRN